MAESFSPLPVRAGTAQAEGESVGDLQARPSPAKAKEAIEATARPVHIHRTQPVIQRRWPGQGEQQQVAPVSPRRSGLTGSDVNSSDDFRPVRKSKLAANDLMYALSVQNKESNLLLSQSHRAAPPLKQKSGTTKLLGDLSPTLLGEGDSAKESGFAPNGEQRHHDSNPIIAKPSDRSAAGSKLVPKTAAQAAPAVEGAVGWGGLPLPSSSRQVTGRSGTMPRAVEKYKKAAIPGGAASACKDKQSRDKASKQKESAHSVAGVKRKEAEGGVKKIPKPHTQKSRKAHVSDWAQTIFVDQLPHLRHERNTPMAQSGAQSGAGSVASGTPNSSAADARITPPATQPERATAKPSQLTCVSTLQLGGTTPSQLIASPVSTNMPTPMAGASCMGPPSMTMSVPNNLVLSSSSLIPATPAGSSQTSLQGNVGVAVSSKAPVASSKSADTTFSGAAGGSTSTGSEISQFPGMSAAMNAQISSRNHFYAAAEAALKARNASQLPALPTSCSALLDAARVASNSTQVSGTSEATAAAAAVAPAPAPAANFQSSSLAQPNPMSSNHMLAILAAGLAAAAAARKVGTASAAGADASSGVDAGKDGQMNGPEVVANRPISSSAQSEVQTLPEPNAVAEEIQVSASLPQKQLHEDSGGGDAVDKDKTSTVDNEETAEQADRRRQLEAAALKKRKRGRTRLQKEAIIARTLRFALSPFPTETNHLIRRRLGTDHAAGAGAADSSLIRFTLCPLDLNCTLNCRGKPLNRQEHDPPSEISETNSSDTSAQGAQEQQEELDARNDNEESRPQGHEIDQASSGLDRGDLVIEQTATDEIVRIPGYSNGGTTLIDGAQKEEGGRADHAVVVSQRRQDGGSVEEQGEPSACEQEEPGQGLAGQGISSNADASEESTKQGVSGAGSVDKKADGLRPPAEHEIKGSHGKPKSIKSVFMDIGRLSKADLSASPDTRVWQIKKHIMTKLAPHLPPSNLVLLCRGLPMRDETKLHHIKTLIWPHKSQFDLVLRFAYRRP